MKFFRAIFMTLCLLCTAMVMVGQSLVWHSCDDKLLLFHIFERHTDSGCGAGCSCCKYHSVDIENGEVGVKGARCNCSIEIFISSFEVVESSESVNSDAFVAVMDYKLPFQCLFSEPVIRFNYSEWRVKPPPSINYGVLRGPPYIA